MSVTDMPHVRKNFMDAWLRMIGMKLYQRRATDYFRNDAASDRRYLLFNPTSKMKVTLQAEEVVNLLWEVIAAKGFEKDTYFFLATSDVRGPSNLEGTVHVNVQLIRKFIRYLLNPLKTKGRLSYFAFSEDANQVVGYSVSGARYVDGYISVSGPVIEVDQDDLLPGTEDKATIGNRNSERRPQKGGADVGVAVAVSPSGVVAVGDPHWRNPVDGVLQVANNAAFVFDGRYRRRRTGDEDQDLAVRHARFGAFVGNLLRDVDDVRVTCRSERQLAVRAFEIHALSLYILNENKTVTIHDL